LVGAPIGLPLLVFFRLLDMLLGYFLATILHSILIISKMTSVISHTAEIPPILHCDYCLTGKRRKACGNSEVPCGRIAQSVLNYGTVWSGTLLATFRCHLFSSY